MIDSPFPVPDGGHVHPFDVPFGPNGERVQAFGMTLRAHFAGLAMVALMRNYQSADTSPQWKAQIALQHADALIKELAK